MSVLREGIEDVRAFVLPDAITVEGRGAAFCRTLLVTWRSVLESVLHQVYVDGHWAGVTLDPQQRQLVVQAPSSFESATLIEVVAVGPEQGHIDFAGEVGQSLVGTSRIKLALLRSQSLPTGAIFNIYFDHGAAEMDYSEPLNDLPIPVWPCPQDKAGLGLSQFGAGDFGYDAAAAVGLGKGAFGHGQFGLDADVIEWISPILLPGVYRFGVKVLDDQGNESDTSETASISVIPAAHPAAALEIVTFDEQANQLILSISDHT